MQRGLKEVAQPLWGQRRWCSLAPTESQRKKMFPTRTGALVGLVVVRVPAEGRQVDTSAALEAHPFGLQPATLLAL